MSGTVKANRGSDDKLSVGRSTLKFLRELVIVVVGALILSGVLRAFVAQPFLIPSPSMENTLLIGDRVVVQKIGDYERGDVIVFKDPGGWLHGQQTPERGPAGKVLEFFGVLPDTSDEHLIKRVIGMPGDNVACCDADGRLTVNGVSLDEEDYLYRSGDTTVAPSRLPFDVVVPEGHLFVMGDHRNVSADSRCHLDEEGTGDYLGAAAFVPQSDVVGTAWVIVAPFDRWRSFSTPDAFAQIPPPTEPAPEEGVISTEVVAC